MSFTLKLLLSQNFCNRPLMRFISFASNIGPAAAVLAGPAPAPLAQRGCETTWKPGFCAVIHDGSSPVTIDSRE